MEHDDKQPKPGPNTEVEGQYYRLLALSRVSAALSSLGDLDAILRIALKDVLSVMEGTIGGILLLDEKTQTLSFRVYQGLSPETAEKMRLTVGQGIVGRVAQTGKAILLEDITKDTRVAYPELVSAEGWRAFISVPLRAKDRDLGVLIVASRTPRQFTRDDMHLLNSIGDQLGVAIEQAALYERLRRTRERYRHLARQILLTQEDERKRIASELHDETTQTLSGLTLQLQALVSMAEMSGQDTEIVARLKKVQSLAIQVHKGISRLIADLRPALLDTLGLIPAIRQYAETSLHPVGIGFSMEVKGLDKRLPPEVETGLFRVIQGAIGNVVRHSRAKNASVVLERCNDELLLRIIDDGVGFDVSKITDIEESGRGRGVFSMRERLMLLGGIGWIESKLGHGTVACGKVPLRRGDEDV